MAYRWFLSYDLDEIIPDYSAISKARAQFGMEIFEEFLNPPLDDLQRHLSVF